MNGDREVRKWFVELTIIQISEQVLRSGRVQRKLLDSFSLGRVGVASKELIVVN